MDRVFNHADIRLDAYIAQFREFVRILSRTAAVPLVYELVIVDFCQEDHAPNQSRRSASYQLPAF